MPKSYIGFQGGNRRRRRIAALYDAWFIRIQSGSGDRVDCRGARRNRVARIERPYIAPDKGRNARCRGAPFGSDQHDRPSSGRWQETMKWIDVARTKNVASGGGGLCKQTSAFEARADEGMTARGGRTRTKTDTGSRQLQR